MPIEIIKKYPEMILNAWDIAIKSKLPDYEFDEILVCGIGGSGIGGLLLKDLLRDRIDCPIEVCSDYWLPYYADDKTLVFCLSYSGDTEETLSQFVEAFRRRCKIIGISSNGKLEEWCGKLKLPFVKLPKGYLPREALPYLFIPLIAYLQKVKSIDFKKDLQETVKVLQEINFNQYYKLVGDLRNVIPVIYTSNKFSAVAKRIQNQFNENSKVPAKHEILPELNHNEINAFQDVALNKNFSVLLLRDEDDSEQIKARFDLTKQLVEGKVKSVNEIFAMGKSLLVKMMTVIAIGDYLSYKLAEAINVDPVEVKNNDVIKAELKKKFNLVQKLEKELAF